MAPTAAAPTVEAPTAEAEATAAGLKQTGGPSKGPSIGPMSPMSAFGPGDNAEASAAVRRRRRQEIREQGRVADAAWQEASAAADQQLQQLMARGCSPWLLRGITQTFYVALRVGRTDPIFSHDSRRFRSEILPKSSGKRAFLSLSIALPTL